MIFRDGKGEREREKKEGRKGGREEGGKERRSVTSCMHPDWGSNLQPRFVP